jgi:hypothetical protein
MYLDLSLVQYYFQIILLFSLQTSLKPEPQKKRTKDLAGKSFILSIGVDHTGELIGVKKYAKK